MRKQIIGLFILMLPGYAYGVPQRPLPNPNHFQRRYIGPIYPEPLLDKNIQGSVIAVCDIYTDGRAHNCHIKSSTHPLFSKATLDYIYKARYRPAEKNGHPVIEYGHTIHVNFSVGD